MSSQVKDLPILCERIAQQIMAYPYKVWGFGEGIGLRAVWEAAAILERPEYRSWVLDYLEAWLHRHPPVQEADHSAPGYSLLDAYELTGDARFLIRAKALADQMCALPVLPSGGTYHRPTHPDYHHYIYVDCMEVDAPFFCRLAQVTNDARWFDTAAEQILGYATLLFDGNRNLFYHQYNGETGQTNGAFWGRGNGWAMLGLLETRTLLPQQHSAWQAVDSLWRAHVDAIVSAQHPDGDWSTVVDDPNAPAEGSLPAMFGYGLARGIQQGSLQGDAYLRAVERAWEATLRRITPDGILSGVSIATPPGSAAHYCAIPTGGVFPWGQAPALLFCLTRLKAESSTS